MLPTKLFAEDHQIKIGVYGISDHFNSRSDGKTYEETNYGLSIIKPYDLSNNITSKTEFEVGAYRNSFDDFAAWIGIGIYMPMNKHLDIGLNVLHWETTRGTYSHQPVVLYPIVRVQVSRKLAFKTRWSPSSVVASFEFHLD